MTVKACCDTPFKHALSYVSEVHTYVGYAIM